MARKSRALFEFASLRLSPDGADTQYRQLENQIRSAIQAGALKPRVRLPSSRALAADLGIARNTVLAAYRQLISEGYLQSVHGSGTTVSTHIPESFDTAGSSSFLSRGDSPTYRFSRRYEQYLATSETLPDVGRRPRPFQPHIPAIDAFPQEKWKRLTREVLSWSESQFGHSDPLGYKPLRQSIAEYLSLSRGVPCDPEQVVVTGGSQQALQLLMPLLINPGDDVWVEEPGNDPAAHALELFGANVVSRPVDGDGIQLESVRKRDAPAMIYVTPACQWPTSTTMSLSRRTELIRFSQRVECWVIEDDYNGEYRFSGRPEQPLSSLDAEGRTIYMGTFSKLLFPGIRLGFVVVPRLLIKPLTSVRWLNDRYLPPLNQMILHRFIESGLFLKHVRQMRQLYRQRRDLLFEQLQESFGNAVRADLPAAGMHLVVRGRTKAVEKKLVSSARKVGIDFHPISLYARHAVSPPGLILGYAAYDGRSTRSAVRRWADAFHG